MLRREDILRDILTFLESNNMSRWQFSKSINQGDYGLVSRIEKGSNPNIKTVNKMYEFMNKHKKDNKE